MRIGIYKTPLRALSPGYESEDPRDIHGPSHDRVSDRAGHWLTERSRAHGKNRSKIRETRRLKESPRR